MSSKALSTLTRSQSGDVASVQRSSTTRTPLTLQRAAIAPSVEPGAEFKVRETLRTAGQPLDPQTRATMEPRFGFDFSGVRVHADSQAAESAKAVRAHAYATGSDLVFGQGQYAPSTPGGEERLSHELTHVVQQSRGAVDGAPVSDGMTVSHPGDRHEQEASHAAASGEFNSFASDSHASKPDHDLVKVQRLAEAQAPNSTDVTQAATGGVSAASSVVFGILGSVYAAESAHAGRRQAAANEDPPIAALTTGGVTQNHLATIPEYKGLDVAVDTGETITTSKKTTPANPKKNIRAETETETKTRDGDDEKGAVTSDVTKRQYKNEQGADVSTTHTRKPRAEVNKGDKERVVKLIRVMDGNANDASFMLHIRGNGRDIKGGNTEDGDISGYLGGSSASNLSINFTQYPGLPLDKTTDPSTPSPEDGMATVRIGFGGNNTPPRMTLHLDSNDPAERNKNYTPQRFAGSVTFDALGRVVESDTAIKNSLKVNPSGTKTVDSASASETNPIITINTAKAPIAPPNQKAVVPASKTPETAPAVPQPPKK
jgi:hypothetical protein